MYDREPIALLPKPQNQFRFCGKLDEDEITRILKKATQTPESIINTIVLSGNKSMIIDVYSPYYLCLERNSLGIAELRKRMKESREIIVYQKDTT